MCGIFAILSSALNENELRKVLIQCSSTLRHRGPDWSGYKVITSNTTTTTNNNNNNATTTAEEHIHGIAHERLAIIDPESGSQPLISPDDNIIVAANGEIYNYKELYDELEQDAIKNNQTPYVPLTGSDCEVLIPLYMKYGPSILVPNKLRGMFSFILYDRMKQIYFIVRDHMGITPLYIGYGKMDGSIYIGSEMKSLHEYCNQLQQFPPGFIYTNAPVAVEEDDDDVETATTMNHHSNDKKFHRWFQPSWAPHMKPGVSIPTEPLQLVSSPLGACCIYFFHANDFMGFLVCANFF
jgi:asparagine synthase (glutamine-hydrolysing)